MSRIEVSQEAQKYLDKAQDLWTDDKKFGELDEDTVREIKGYLALAIKKAGGPYLDAEEEFAYILHCSGEYKDALKHANNALILDPFSFLAQYVRVGVFLDNTKDYKVHVSDFFETSGDWVDMIIGTATKGLTSTFFAGSKIKSQFDLRRELLKLIESYRHNCLTMTNPYTFVNYSNKMMFIARWIENIKIPLGRPNLYLEIVNAPISSLHIEGYEEKVEAIRIKAEGQSELFKP